MNFGEAKTRVQDAIGAGSNELTSQLGTFVTDALRDIHAAGRWPWDRKASTFSVLEDVKTTVSGSHSIGADHIHTVATHVSGYDNGLVKIGGNVYDIVSWVSTNNKLTVSPDLITTPVVGDSVQIIQETVSLPSDVETVIDVIDMAYPRVLSGRAGNQCRRLFPDPFLTLGAFPYEWWARGVDSSGNIQLVLYPPPDEKRVYQVEYWRRVQLPTSDSDELEAVTGIQERFHPVIVAGAKYKAFEFEFENEGVKASAQGEFLAGISRMRNFSRADAGAIRSLRSDRSRFVGRNRYLPTDRITGYTSDST